MTAFFTSDLHFGHKNLTQESTWEDSTALRPFQNAEEMDATIVRDWNSRVKKGDTVYILGDLSFRLGEATAAILAQLHGQKVLIKGNHDHSDRIETYRHLLAKTADYLERRMQTDNHGPVRICMFHFPILSWAGMHRGTWHFHGHSHGHLNYPDSLVNGRIVDVGIDATQPWSGHWGPVALDEIMEEYSPFSVPLSVESHREVKK